MTGTVKFRVDLIKDIKIVKEAPAETDTGEDALDPAIVEQQAEAPAQKKKSNDSNKSDEKTTDKGKSESEPQEPKKEEKARRQLEKFAVNKDEEGSGEE